MQAFDTKLEHIKWIFIYAFEISPVHFCKVFKPCVKFRQNKKNVSLNLSRGGTTIFYPNALSNHIWTNNLSPWNSLKASVFMTNLFTYFHLGERFPSITFHGAIFGLIQGPTGWLEFLEDVFNFLHQFQKAISSV